MLIRIEPRVIDYVAGLGPINWVRRYHGCYQLYYSDVNAFSPIGLAAWLEVAKSTLCWQTEKLVSELPQRPDVCTEVMHLAVLYFRRKCIFLYEEVLLNYLTWLQRVNKVKATKFAEPVCPVRSLLHSNRI